MSCPCPFNWRTWTAPELSHSASAHASPTYAYMHARAGSTSRGKLTFLPVAFSNIERSLSVIFSFCFLYFAESTGWPDWRRRKNAMLVFRSFFCVFEMRKRCASTQVRVCM